MADTDIRALLTDLEDFGRKNDAEQTDGARKMRNLEPETAHLLHILVRSGNRTRLLEIGTSNGYSTIWLAWAAKKTGGHLISIDENPEKHQLAEANLRRADLWDQVVLLSGDATQFASALPGPFDLVFFDADRISAPAQLALLLPKLTADALILADNVLSHPQEIAAYLAAVEAIPGVNHLVVPIGKGLSLAYK